ncbi:phage tail protein [Shewanella frigidimarina]|uniref:phage tail-collar fiber domain-containing protein n=1 Tax=Shewanella frigidimarina TaxID=56812 RepID=UPI003D7A369F
MAQVITIAGERLFALKAQNNEQLDIDTFIFANVPGQDPNATIDRNESVPPVGQQVHQQIVQQVGRVNDNVVIYSTVLDSLTGPFDFNWVGLYSSVNQTLIAVSHIPSVSKTITVPGAAGNTLNRNFGIEYSGIADLTGITVQPETWQLDFTARLSGMDELTRQLAADMNGKDWFIDDGFKVVPRSTTNTFKVTSGAGYVSGLRVELIQDHILTLQSYPQFVYVDTWFDGDASSQWKPKTAFTVTNGEMDDYIDVNGKQHYVFKLALITAANSVEDLRNVDGLAQKIEKIDKKNGHTLINDNVNRILGVTNSVESKLKVIVTGDSLSFNGFGYPAEWGVNGGGYATEQPFGLMGWAYLMRDFLLSSSGAFRSIKNINWQTDASANTVGVSKNHGMNMNVIRFSFLDDLKKLVLDIDYSGTSSLIVSSAPLNEAVKFTIDDVEFDNLTETGDYKGYGYKKIPITSSFIKISNVRKYTDESIKGGVIDVYGTTGINSVKCDITGKGVWTSGQILSEFDRLVEPYAPDVIFYIIGANDIDQGVPVNEFYENINSFINRARAIKPDCAVILISTPPTSSWANDKSISYIEKMSEIASKNNLTLIDLVHELKDINPSSYRYDNIHFSKKGDDIFFNIIKKYILSNVNVETNKFIPSRESFTGATINGLRRNSFSCSFLLKTTGVTPSISYVSDYGVVEVAEAEYFLFNNIESVRVRIPFGMSFNGFNEVVNSSSPKQGIWDLYFETILPNQAIVFYKKDGGVGIPIIGSNEYLHISLTRSTAQL